MYVCVHLFVHVCVRVYVYVYIACENNEAPLMLSRHHRRTRIATSSSIGCQTAIVTNAMNATVAFTRFGAGITVESVARSSAVSAVTRRCQGRSWALQVSVNRWICMLAEEGDSGLYR